MMLIRPAEAKDDGVIWRILEPVIRAGETYVLPRDLSADAALAYWRTPEHAVFVAESEGKVVGTYYLRANQRGGGAHVSNCAYMTPADFTGRGVARAMCAHSLDHAKAQGFRAMQYNFVIST